MTPHPGVLLSAASQSRAMHLPSLLLPMTLPAGRREEAAVVVTRRVVARLGKGDDRCDDCWSGAETSEEAMKRGESVGLVCNARRKGCRLTVGSARRLVDKRQVASAGRGGGRESSGDRPVSAPVSPDPVAISPRARVKEREDAPECGCMRGEMERGAG
jgi:hypothetical protein